jgi:hypothetical protein
MAKLRPNNSLAKHDQEGTVEAGRQFLLDGGYPNPDRVGCPGRAILKALAERKADLRDAREEVLHIGMCSACFIEYTEFQERRAKQKKLEFALAGAALLIVFGVGGWLWKAKWAPRKPSQPLAMTLDLRNWIVPRGDETTGSNSGPIKLPRARLDLKIFLPVGSPPGRYEVQVSTESGRPVINAVGDAGIENGITVAKVRVDLSKIESGDYVFSIGKLGMERRSYPLAVK